MERNPVGKPPNPESKDKGDKSMAEKHIRLKSVYKRDMRDQRRGMVKAKLL